MSGDKLHRLQRLIADISVFLHTEMSSLPQEDSQPDLSAVLRLDPAEALLRVKATVSELVQFKRDVVMSREYEDFRTTQQYQTALQKLESEVRNHIKVQQQLKIHIENLHGQMEGIERENEKLKKEQRQYREGEENRDQSLREKLLQENTQFRHAAKRDQTRLLELEKTVERAERECAERAKECDRLHKELERQKTLLGHMKENVQFAGDYRCEGTKRSFQDSENRSISPFGVSTLSQRACKAIPQRSSSSDRIKSVMRPLTAKRVNCPKK